MKAGELAAALGVSVILAWSLGWASLGCFLAGFLFGGAAVRRFR